MCTIEIISIIISAIALAISVYNQHIIIVDRYPQLAFELFEYKHMIYLKVKNEGVTEAKNIKIKVNSINNNGSNSELQLDDIFKNNFELASKEFIQGQIGIFGENIDEHVFPNIDIEVRYEKNNFIKKVKYSRKVYFKALTDEIITVNTGVKIDNLENYSRQIHRDLNRVANYFDGNEIADFDEISLLSENHFQTDMLNVKENKKSKVYSREECIKNRLMNEKRGN